MAKGVWRDGFLYACHCCLLLYHDEYHGASKVGSPSVEKNIIFLAWLYFHVATVIIPQVKLLYGFARNGNKTFLRAFAPDSQKSLIFIDLRKSKVDQFRDTQSARKQNLDDGTVAVSFPLAQVDACLKHIYLLRRKHLWQMLVLYGRLKQFRRVLLHPAVHRQELVEGSDSAKNPCMGRRGNAHVVQ